MRYVISLLSSLSYELNFANYCFQVNITNQHMTSTWVNITDKFTKLAAHLPIFETMFYDYMVLFS